MRMNDIKNFLQIIIFILASLIGKAILKALKGIGLIFHPSKIFKIKNQQLKIQNPIRGIDGVDVTGGAEYLTHVLGEVKASRRTSGALAWQAVRGMPWPHKINASIPLKYSKLKINNYKSKIHW